MALRFVVIAAACIAGGALAADSAQAPRQEVAAGDAEADGQEEVQTQRQQDEAAREQARQEDEEARKQARQEDEEARLQARRKDERARKEDEAVRKQVREELKAAREQATKAGKDQPEQADEKAPAAEAVTLAAKTAAQDLPMNQNQALAICVLTVLVGVVLAANGVFRWQRGAGLLSESLMGPDDSFVRLV